MEVSSLIRQMRKAGKSLWEILPDEAKKGRLALAIGSAIHARAGKRGLRNAQAQSTWFLRNRPLLETTCELIDECGTKSPVRICSIGCSTGAEVFSLLWLIRRNGHRREVVAKGIDRLDSVIEKARTAVFTREDPELEGLGGQEMGELFRPEGDQLKVRDWIAKGTEWHVADARRQDNVGFGQHDIVLANNFLIHLDRVEAASCLSEVIGLVRPGGFLVCSGVDLDLREETVRRFKLQPVGHRIEEIHNADHDRGAIKAWPWAYWSLEPLNKRRANWQIRYASIFRVPDRLGSDSDQVRRSLVRKRISTTVASNPQATSASVDGSGTGISFTE
jgi:chemotaxis protein methyltransferase CheR